MNPQTSETSLELKRDFAKIAKGTTVHIQKMRQEVLYTDGSVPAKFKVLSALLWSISSRCLPCVMWYAHKASEAGISEQELGEFLAVASVMGGCVGETWAIKAYEAFKAPEPSSSEPTSCCE